MIEVSELISAFGVAPGIADAYPRVLHLGVMLPPLAAIFFSRRRVLRLGAAHCGQLRLTPRAARPSSSVARGRRFFLPLGRAQWFYFSLDFAASLANRSARNRS